MASVKKARKRQKRSGIIYFAVNSRIPDIVKIGMTTATAESRLLTANKKHEFMCGRWSITQKVKTNDVKRTEELAHTMFQHFHDKESVSSEMYFIPSDMSVKNMADSVRKNDKEMLEQYRKRDKAKAELERIEQETKETIIVPISSHSLGANQEN